MKCGIVDVGSNTMRLSIYHWEGRSFKLLMNKKEMAGLAGYIKGGVLSDSGILVACRVLAEYKTLLDNLGVKELHVFGTAPLRNIVNTEEALDAIRAVTGVSVEVLSGTDEAALSFLGATVGGGAPAAGLLADIGGGSTELVAYENSAITSGCSLPMGSLSLFTDYVSGLFPTKEERRAIRARVERELEKARTAGVRCAHLTGVGGTIRAAAKRGDQATLRQILRTAPDRVHTILPGLVIFSTVVKSYGVETVSVSAYGVREGYLLQRVMGVDGHGA